MTIHEAVFSAWRQPLLGILFLLLTGQLALVTAAFRDGRSRRVKASLLAVFALSAAVLWVFMAMIFWNNNDPEGARPRPGWLPAAGGLPAAVPALYEALAAVLLALSLRDALRYRKTHPTPDSVRQTMDLLPVGVAYGAADGTVYFRNLVMDRLSRELTGRGLTDFGTFRSAAGGGPVSAAGRVWQINAHAAPETSLIQLTATNITEQARILDDLRVKNQKLKDIRLRLQLYNRQAERIVIAQKMLTARMTVHDELGSVLLESRHYMSDPSSIDEELLLQALKNANTYLLREYEGDDTAVDQLAEAFGAARAIGVRAELTGVPPAEDGPRAVLAAAVRECAANAVKHADGDRLTADARRTDAGYVFTLCTNGRPPAGPVRETGGLLSLRTLVENRHGAMRVEADPAFRLTIALPPPGADGH